MRILLISSIVSPWGRWAELNRRLKCYSTVSSTKTIYNSRVISCIFAICLLFFGQIIDVMWLPSHDAYIIEKDLKEYFFKRYNGSFNYSLFIRTISRFDKSLFRQIKKMLPARTKSNVGFYIESHILERNKQKVANKPIPEEVFYEQKIDIGSEQDGIITPSGENRAYTGSFENEYETNATM